MKTIRVTDEAYEKIAEFAARDKRTIISTVDVLVDKAQEAESYNKAELEVLKQFASMSLQSNQ